MNGLFNGQILMEKLAKLNNSQQSIETLSHWCIFHRNKAKQVVETWDRQFYCSPKDQRVSFLYLANDILQNSRRKGFEFVGEFWKVLPDALNDVIENGDEFGKNAVLRLVGIWEERKVFGSRGQILKEEFLGRNLDSGNINGKVISYKLKQPTGGDTLEKLISCYGHFYDGSVDEDVLFEKCKNAITFVEKLEKDIGSDLGNINGSGIVEELQGQHVILGECVEQLKAAEACRSSLLSQLREALNEQEFKIDQVRNQLQAAQSRYDQVRNMCQQLLSCSTGQSPSKPGLDEAPPTSDASPSLIPEAPAAAEDEAQSTPACNIQQGYLADNFSHNVEEQRKTEAAAVAAKLTASSSSAEMLSYVLSSLASEGVIGQSVREDHPSNGKRAKLDSFVPYMPAQPQPPPPPFPHPDSLGQPPPPLSSPGMQPLQPPPPVMLPPRPPLPPPRTTQFMQTSGSMAGMLYSYSSPRPLQRPAFSSFQTVGIPAPYPSPLNPYLSFQRPEGAGLFGQPPFPAASPVMSPNKEERILL